MNASTEPPTDAELLRLLDEYASAVSWANGDTRKEQGARAALLAHIATHYSRRWSSYPPHLRMPELYADLPEDSPGPPIVAGPLARRAVRIRLSDG